MFLLCVVVAAKKEEDSFWSAMAGLLEERFQVLRAYAGVLEAKDEEAQLILADMNYRAVRADQVVFVYRDYESVNPELPIDANAIAIVDSSKEDLLAYVATTGLPAITCGLSAKDTVTLSSMRTDSAVINLQRGVTCFDGSLAEPQEIPIKRPEDADSFAVMAASAICLLAGKSPEHGSHQ
jgi:hypothetical protein